MRVLVTRPEEAGEKTARRLRELGHVPVSLPLFRAIHRPLDQDATTRDAFGGIILTSAEAIRALKGAEDLLRDLTDLPVFAVGKATARAACGAGFGKIHVASGYGRDLAGLIEEKHVHRGLPLLYLAGTPRSPDLEAGLRARAIPFETRLAYRMEAVEHTKAELEAALTPGLAVLLYSREAALRFLALLETLGTLPELDYYCLSPAIAAALGDVSPDRLHVAGETTEEALLALLPAP